MTNRQSIPSKVLHNHETAVRVILRHDDGTILIQRRPQGPALYAGLWEFPGGTLEMGEEPRHGCVREILEELGIELRREQLRFLHKADFPPGGYGTPFTVHCFTSRYNGDPLRPKPDEVEAVRWVPPAILLEEVRHSPKMFMTSLAEYPDAILNALKRGRPRR